MTSRPIAMGVPIANRGKQRGLGLGPPADRPFRRRPPARYPALLSSPVHLTAGTLFAGDFRVVRPLSEGGMGAVYVVEQVSTGKERALKIMHAQLVANERLRQRFEQEARVGARIESDHIVEVVGAGVDVATGMPWLAMELLRGETLGAFITRTGALPPAVVRDVFAQICHALGAAHTLGIVHRDLKPENVFLEVPKREGIAFTAKILDFGIAKMIAESATKHTAAIGTPLWMAPEQTESRGIVAPATDVWALGLIAFHLLTGRMYWREANQESPSTMVLMREICVDSLPFASMRAAELGVGHLLPRGFDEWFARCLHRDSSTRFPDATALRRALDPILVQASVAAGGAMPSTLAMAPRPSERALATMAAPPGPRTLAVAAQETVLPHPPYAKPQPSPNGSRAPLLVAAASVVGLLTVLLVFLLRASTTSPAPTKIAKSASPTPTASNDSPLGKDDDHGANDEVDDHVSVSSSSTSFEMKTETTSKTKSTSTMTSTSTTSISTTTTAVEPNPPPEPTAPQPFETNPTPKDSKADDAPPFDKSATKTALQAVAYKNCGTGGKGKVSIVFAPSGTISSTNVPIGDYDEATKTCIRARFKAAKVPPFSGLPVTVGWTIIL